MKIKCEEVDFSQTDWLVLKQEDLFEQRSNFSVEKVFKIQLNSIKVWKVVYFLYARKTNLPAWFFMLIQFVSGLNLQCIYPSSVLREEIEGHFPF